ncbi:HNH endonuclease [Dechloromonas sp. XY25]|uniref:HNH endonuclease n=1 Tax=Dechloromonas hankyongensis TaxID=2908002 RepID=A0ABS9K4I9_9RHOO|nr:HNH endonuclease [Dechloromonas hankyongensis]MCG2578092.1 HNH endonuclease [Dechloromonas hankyongensis]
MIFEDWMLHKGLSASTSLKYDGAIKGALTEWGMDNGLLEGPLTAIRSRTQFESISKQIRELPIFHERNERGHHMYSSALLKYAEYLSEGFDSDIESDIETIIADPSISMTEKNSLVKARIGQGTFRQRLIGLWGGCSVTGFTDCNLLVASHIKPWRASSNAERMDKFNGLLLIPNLDRAFDAGLITFEKDGEIKVSPQMSEPEKLGIQPKLRVALKSENEIYMEFHRSEVFRSF